MSTNLTSPSQQRGRIHPLIAGASVAVILASVTAVAAMTGLLPSSRALTAPVAAPVAVAPVATQAVVAAPTTQAPTVAQQAPAQPRVYHRRSAPVAPPSSYAGDNGYQSVAQPATRPVAIDPGAGEVVAINTVQTPEPTSGIGAVGGAVAGGLLGNQFGAGRGRVLTTIVGAVGGGLAGNGIEHAVRKTTNYQVQVKMQDGSYRNFNYTTQPQMQIGERVHVSGDSLSAS
ncbi:glycine zipper 2TM domain-containing protein [Paraburkholderia sp.]|uniref:glycine zipper 2TM domain-containing protein n=1 Tax=Paraburkholderia sp. TaxID=1926495 RepID=UPI00238F84D5|nr:glycine zipper 2TM domain-containing protein [Paraburkholderia sp.]MDE1179035.1 glycine zipper 2TM domain-containing protein [Paraburkholderia sp.]